MGKYDDWKRLILPINIVKKSITTTNPLLGQRLATAGPGNEGINLAEWFQEQIDNGDIVITAVPSGYYIIKYNGTAVNQRQFLNFIGDGFTVLDDGVANTEVSLAQILQDLSAVIPSGVGDILYFDGSNWLSAKLDTYSTNVSSGTTVTTTYIPLSGLPITVFVNGVYQTITEDYSRVDDLFTFTETFSDSDLVTINYYR